MLRAERREINNDESLIAVKQSRAGIRRSRRRLSAKQAIVTRNQNTAVECLPLEVRRTEIRPLVLASV